MKKQNLLILLLLIVAVFSITLIIIRKEGREEEFEAENEGRPDQPTLSGAEKEMFVNFLESRQEQALLKLTSTENKSSYANGKISGTWSSKISHTVGNGYRVDNSAYDSLRNFFYVVSYAGHLYKLEYENEVKWTLLNQKVQMNPPDNGTANPIFIGTLLPDSTFRLIRSNDAASRVEYSDDEGITWHTSTGANVSQSWSNEAFEITNNGQKKIILHTYSSNYHHIYYSSDNGATYTEFNISLPSSTVDVKIAKPFFTNDAYLWVWNKSSKKISTYKYNPDSNDFILVVNSTSTLAGTYLSSAAATYYNGTLHFYLSTINSKYTIYYSNDGGTTWVQKNAGRDKPFETICPENPNTLLSGFEDMKVSNDYGTNWTGFGNKLGWDLQHMRTYEMSGGKTITLAGLDFGCYVSQTPQNPDSYKWCNNGAWYAMHYDAASSENFNSIYMANQDRGTTAYLDSGVQVNTVDVDGTDVLRTCFANHEISVWTWFYYGRIKHRFNFPTGKSGEAVYDGLGNWWAAPIIASPNPSEDAIYAAYGSNLQIFKYNSSTNSVAKTAHPFNFKTKFGDNLAGFGYSNLDRNIWYAALNNGTFLYSKDAGATWKKSAYTGTKPRGNDQTYNYAKNQIVIQASQIDTNRVYYAGVGNEILISENNGSTFSLKSTGLSISRIRDFALSPDEKFIFAACGYGGAWVYSVDDNRWYQMSDDPIPSVDFTYVEFIHRKNCVRFGTFGSGILDLTLDQQFYTVASPANLQATLTNMNQKVKLSWSDQSDNEDGFYVERAIEGDFLRIDTIAANTTSYTDSNVRYNQTCYYRLKAYKNNSESFKSNLAYVTIPQKGIYDQSKWSLVACSSQEINGEYAPAIYAFDNNPATFWHTEWQNAHPAHPHYIIIDMGEESTIAGFRYLPRQDGNTNGIIAKYEFYVTNNLSNWGTPAVTGTFGSGSGWKESMFGAPTTGRYIKLVALSAIGGGIYTSAAEIAVLYQQVPPDAPVNLTASVVSDNIINLRWKDNSINAAGFIVEKLIDSTFVAIDSVRKTLKYYNDSNLFPGTLYTYRLRSYNAGGPSEVSNEVKATTTNSTGISAKQVEWKVYPNPCIDNLNIQLDPLNKAATVKVIGVNGKNYITQKIDVGETQIKIQMTDLPAGVYIIELFSNGQQTIRKVTKQ